MATATLKKSQISSDNIPQLITLPERVSVVEIEVKNINEKIDDLKYDVKDMHDCLDRTRDSIMDQLEKMHKASCDQHNELAGKVGDLEKFKNKWTYLFMGGIAVLGWAGGHATALGVFLK
jgi:tetrahydromethanopterin S-methyltransferase subunit B